ncbi:hypothetical protein PGT21_003026 [Puccinia graminis f. sp. tritici]|uniref:Uncharacterized protein n=1 Tax=Puccinia graminis f. sp. tritici TaxID=56615 RepID=A0A5B0P3K7_PUCGR|nr:hypothetical protein PGT21_003026 [Puccinia graminis f. sp. tritici]
MQSSELQDGTLDGILWAGQAAPTPGQIVSDELLHNPAPAECRFDRTVRSSRESGGIRGELADLTYRSLRRFASRKGAGVGAGSRSVSYAVACRRQYSPPFSDLIEWALPHRWRATWAVLSGCEAMTINDFLETVLVRLARS